MIEHYTTGIYLGTTDWPHQNAGQWRNYGNKIEGNKFGDGKWRFMAFDMDYTMGAGWGEIGPDVDNFRKLESKSELSPTNLFIALYRNDEFKKRFTNIYCDYVNEIMNIEKIIPMIAKYKEENSDLVGYSQLRWWGGEKIQGYTHWKQNYISVMDKIQQFFELRPQFTLNHIKQHLQLKGELNELTIITSEKDKIQINYLIFENWGNKVYFRFF